MSQLELLQEWFTNNLSLLTLLSQSFAYMGGLLYLLAKVGPSLMKGGQPIDMYPLLRPFLIVMLITSYAPMMQGLNYLLKPITMATQIMLSTMESDASTTKWSEELDRMRRKEMEESQSDPAKDKELQDAVAEKGGDSEVMARSDEYLQIVHNARWSGCLGNLLVQGIYNLCEMILVAIRSFFLIVLSTFGPIVLSMCLFPTWETKWHGWLSTYISVYMWLPIVKILNMVMITTQGLCINGQLELGYATAYFLLGIIGYLCVPTIASWIIQGSGAGHYVSTGKGMLAGAARMATGKIV